MWSFRRPPSPTTRTQTTPCRDLLGCSADLQIGLTCAGEITLTSPHGDVAVLTCWQVGPLRAALRSAAIASMIDDTDPLPEAASEPEVESEPERAELDSPIPVPALQGW